MISAALRRCVWCGPSHSPLYPNLYIILTGEPAMGKGLVIKEVAKILRHHKMPDPREKTNQKQLSNGVAVESMSDEQRQLIRTVQDSNETLQKQDFEAANKEEEDYEKKTKDSRFFEKPLLLPVAADATTYEALVKSMARSYRRRMITRYDEKTQKDVPDSYGHSSLCFCLEEISSLFRKRTEDLVHFLIQAYDCGDYTYDTKTQGKDRVRKCCLNFFGGTTPGFMQSCFNDQLISEGFSSRTHFIFASQNRDRPFWIPALTKEQEQYWLELVQHVLKLSNLYGAVSFSKDANDLLEDWWKSNKEGRPNTSIKLNPYYGRKKVHVLKMAMGIHFGESYDMTIQKVSVERALNVLAEEEKKMHLCLGFDSGNLLTKPADIICKSIHQNGERFTFRDILAEHWNILPGKNKDEIQTSLETIMERLEVTGKVQTLNAEHPVTKQLTRFYKAFKKSVI